MGGGNIQPVGIAHMQGDRFRDQILFHQIKAEQIHHFLDDQEAFIIRIVAGEYLSAADAGGMRPVGFNICHGDAFDSPGVINQEFRVDAEEPV